MGKENRINTALFLNILIYCCFFGFGIFDYIFKLTFSPVTYHIIGILCLVGIPVTYLVALFEYISKKKRDNFQLVLLIILPLIFFGFLIFAFVGAAVSGAGMM